MLLNQLLLYGSNYRAVNDSELHTKHTSAVYTSPSSACASVVYVGVSIVKTSLQVIRPLYCINTDLYSYRLNYCHLIVFKSSFKLHASMHFVSVAICFSLISDRHRLRTYQWNHIKLFSGHKCVSTYT